LNLENLFKEIITSSKKILFSESIKRESKRLIYIILELRESFQRNYNFFKEKNQVFRGEPFPSNYKKS
jgi:hypothetical protein